MSSISYLVLFNIFNIITQIHRKKSFLEALKLLFFLLIIKIYLLKITFCFFIYIFIYKAIFYSIIIIYLLNFKLSLLINLNSNK